MENKESVEFCYFCNNIVVVTNDGTCPECSNIIIIQSNEGNSL